MESPPPYRHRPHAANLSDLMKHLCLSSLRHLPELETLWDAFAAEAYTPYSQLAAREALLSALMALQGPDSLTEYQATLQRFQGWEGEPAYPGSAAILAGFDAVQTLLLSDHDPACIDRQAQYFRHRTRPRVIALNMDSVKDAEPALVHRPDLVFIDPPFLSSTEWQGIESLLHKLWRTKPQCRAVVWYPLRQGFSVPATVLQVRGWRMEFQYAQSQGLKGCGVLMANFGSELEPLLRPLAECLDAGKLPGLSAVQCLRQP